MTKPEPELSNSLKAARARRGWSQQQLADAARVSRQTISGLEAGLYSPSAAVALRLARALNCSMDDLFWLEDDVQTVTATVPEGKCVGPATRVALARVGGSWVAHPLVGREAFRTEMVPAGGVVTGAASAGQVPVSLLGESHTLSRTVVLSGCSPALALWARSAEQRHPGLRVHWIHGNSMRALGSLARGEVHGAGIHLFDPVTGTHNVPFVRQTIPGRSVALINLGVWEEGLLVRQGNPRNIRVAEHLAQPNVTLVNREEGAGSRLLLDTLLANAGIPPDQVCGYDDTVTSHEAVGERVASGAADVGVSSEAIARIFGLDFVAIQPVRYDVAILEEYLHLEPVTALLNTLQNRWVRSQLALLGGYDTSSTGEVVLVS
jgi:molybdate-binding protein/DNA-binding XRE family transcriptional regulator